MYKIEPPENRDEFTKRLRFIVSGIYDDTFGLAYCVGFSDKRLLNDRSSSNVFKIWKMLERYNNKKNHKIDEETGYQSSGYKVNPHCFLKEALEENFLFQGCHQNSLGIYIDRSGITLPEKNRIAVQVAAQVIMSEEQKPILWRLAKLRRKIKDNKEITELLWLSRFSKERTIDSWIKPIFPLAIRPTRGNKKANLSFQFSESCLTASPGIIFTNSNRINYQKLYFAITILSKILSVFRKSQEEILNHTIFCFYKKLVPLYVNYVCDEWVKEALIKDFSKAVFWV